MIKKKFQKAILVSHSSKDITMIMKAYKNLVTLVYEKTISIY